MDREAWCAAIHGVAKCRARLNGWTDFVTQALTISCLSNCKSVLISFSVPNFCLIIMSKPNSCQILPVPQTLWSHFYLLFMLFLLSTLPSALSPVNNTLLLFPDLIKFVQTSVTMYIVSLFLGTYSDISFLDNCYRFFEAQFTCRLPQKPHCTLKYSKISLLCEIFTRALTRLTPSLIPLLQEHCLSFFISKESI